MNSKIMFSLFLAVLFTVGLVSATCCNVDYDSMSTTKTVLVDGYEYQDSLGVKVNFNKKVNNCACTDFDSMSQTRTMLVGAYTLPVYHPSLVNQDMGCFGCTQIVVNNIVPQSKVVRCY